MIKNLLNTGTVFDYSADDQSFVDDLLNVDLQIPFEVTDGIGDAHHEKTFEDED